MTFMVYAGPPGQPAVQSAGIYAKNGTPGVA
jgi:hypothetical protein